MLYAAFTKDLLLDPSSRDVSDVKHIVVAAASSSSAERAKKFLADCGSPSDAKAYGSYPELVEDPNVDIVYVATPHSHHYQNAMLCLLAGKHVLCEKAFTTNALQAKKLIETAKEKKLFLMEAVWTRFFPMSIQIRKMIQDGELGDVHRVIADNVRLFSASFSFFLVFFSFFCLCNFWGAIRCLGHVMGAVCLKEVSLLEHLPENGMLTLHAPIELWSECGRTMGNGTQDGEHGSRWRGFTRP